MIDSTSTRYSRSRGRIQNGSGSVSYPHPFFDIASTYIPQSMQSLFRHLMEFYLLNGFFNVVVNKLAEYPITDLVFSDKDKEVGKRWGNYFEDTLQFRQFQVSCGLDYYCYGNTLVSARFPITKWLICDSCKHRVIAAANRKVWNFRGMEFHLNCPKCSAETKAKVEDIPKKTPEAIRLIRWDPSNVQIHFDPLNRTRTYYFRITGQLRADIALGRKDVVEETPQVYLDACRRNEMVVLPADQIFHMMRPNISGFDPAWGLPLLFPVLKEAFQLTLMRKSQETVLLEHLVPLRVLFPQPAAGTADPFSSIPLTMWKDAVTAEISRWRWDPAYIPVMPLPIGQQSIGGDGKALLVQPEMQALIDHIIVCMGVPREFIFGGASWSGSNVSLRTVENMFFGYIQQHLQLVRFVQRKVASVTDWPLSTPRFKPIRMSDDIQRKQLLLSMRQGDMLSETTFLEECMDLDMEREQELKTKEATLLVKSSEAKQTALAHMQGRIGAINLDYQLKQQELQQNTQMQQQAAMAAQQPQPVDPMAEEQQAMAAQQAGPMFDQMLSSRLTPGGGGPGIPATAMADVMAKQIASAPPKMQYEMLQNLKAQMGPEIFELVSKQLGSVIAQGGSEHQGAAVGAPDPQQRPPRRPQS